MTDEFLGLRKVAEQAVTRGVKMPLSAKQVLDLLDRVEKAEGELDLMEQTLDLSKMVEDKVKKKLDRAEQALQRVREWHQWNRVDQYDDVLGDWVEEYCQGCHEVWPCATIRTLEGDDEN